MLMWTRAKDSNFHRGAGPHETRPERDGDVDENSPTEIVGRGLEIERSGARDKNPPRGPNGDRIRS
jgi:hypothetical protein